MRLPRWRQTTSCSTSTARPSASSTPTIASTVCPPTGRPSATSPVSSSRSRRTCATAVSLPSAMTSFPRSETRAPARSATASSRRSRSAPSSCASALSMGNVSVATPPWYPGGHGRPIRAVLLREAGPHALLHALAVGPAGRERHRLAHDLPHVARALGADLGDRALDDRLEIAVGKLRRKVALDQLGLDVLRRGAIGVPRVLERLGGLAAALELASQDGLHLVVGERAPHVLLGIAQRREHEAQRVAAHGVARLHGRLDILVDAIDHATLPTATRSPGASSTTSTRSPTPAPACARNSYAV